MCSSVESYRFSFNWRFETHSPWTVVVLPYRVNSSGSQALQLWRAPVDPHTKSSLPIATSRRSSSAPGIKRPTGTCCGITGDWFRSSHLRVYPMYSRARSKQQVFEKFTPFDPGSCRKRSLGHLLHCHCHCRMWTRTRQLRVFIDCTYRYSRGISAGRTIWSQLWTLDSITVFHKRTHQPYFSILAIHTPGCAAYRRLHERDRQCMTLHNKDRRIPISKSRHLRTVASTIIVAQRQEWLP